jgi:hypothetical protein
MRFPSWLFGLSFLCLVGACGGNVVVDGDSGAGGAPGTGGSGIVCSDAGPQDIPAAERQCATISDCTIEPVPVQYCALFAVGVASSEVGAFQAYESACDQPGPTHTCPIFTVVTLTQDGKSTPGHVVDQAQVACQSGLCTTFMP